jgi:hypothetical protein
MEMKLKKLVSTRQGFSVIEALVASVIFTILIMAFLGSFLLFQKSYLFYGDENRGALVAEEGLEAVRNIYDESFDILIDGTYGLDYSSGKWQFLGSLDVEGIYKRSIVISTVDSDTKKVISNVTWQRSNLSDGSLSLFSYFTNWRKLVSQDGCITADTGSACFDSPSNYQLLTNITIKNNCDYDVSINSVTMDWNNIIKLQGIDINGQSRWLYNCSYNCSPSGAQNSGALLNFGDNIFTITAGTTLPVNKIYWDSSMTGATIGPIVFESKDGSKSTIDAFSPPQCSVPDTTAPSAISNLSISSFTTSTVSLSWTAPGDDANIGTAASYDIRYSTSAITDANWASAIQVTGEPTPLIAGTTQSMTIASLSPNATYYFGMKTFDEVLNTSSLSNIVSATTQALPTQAGYLDVNISGRRLSTNRKDVLGITLRNTGNLNIVISQMTVSWIGGSVNSRLNTIRINNNDVWSGISVSGQVSNITDITIPALTTRNLNYLRFSHTMNGSNMTIIFTMLDGSTKTVTNITF